jgi:hypothetical protein
MSLAEGKMPTRVPSLHRLARRCHQLVRHSGTRNDAFVSIPVWTRLGCPGVCFFSKHQHECLQGTPQTPSTLHPQPRYIHAGFRVPGLHGDPRYGASCNYFLTVQLGEESRRGFALHLTPRSPHALYHPTSFSYLQQCR